MSVAASRLCNFFTTRILGLTPQAKSVPPLRGSRVVADVDSVRLFASAQPAYLTSLRREVGEVACPLGVSI